MKYLIIFLSLLVAFTATAQQQVGKPIRYNAFSHNDYWRENPMFDALSYCFNCVEADLWLINGELYVVHDKPEPSPEITFLNLYLKPLAAYISDNNGNFFTWHGNAARPYCPCPC